jgi:hypothetical protein
MSHQIPISVADVDQLLVAGFTHIEIWKSEDFGNSYLPLTKAASEPPVLDSLPALTTFAIGGRSIVLDFSGTPVTFSFDPTFLRWTLQQTVDRMNQVRPGCAAAVGGAVRVTGTGLGRGQFVKVVSSPPGCFVDGTEQRGVDPFLPLVPGQVLYTYQDLGGGAATDRYRWRFSHNGVAPFSELGRYVVPQPPPHDASTVSTGYATFVNLDGSPARGRLIIVEDSPPKVGQVTIQSGPMVVEADETGFLQVRLLKGAKVRVAIEGTSIARSITVPQTATFDIMAAISDAPDAFSPATTTPLLTRRSI